MTRREQAGTRQPEPSRARAAVVVAGLGGLYAGQLLADDIEQLAARSELATPSGGGLGSARAGHSSDLLGNHDDDAPLPDALEQALDRARKEMNGGGIWRSAGAGRQSVRAARERRSTRRSSDGRRRRWPCCGDTCCPRRGAPRTPVTVSARLPVLSTADRRAFLRAQWSPFLPEARWDGDRTQPEGRAQVYLDVSGSMNAEMPLVVALLGRLVARGSAGRSGRSADVVPAVIERGALKAGTTGGTSLECVLEHVARTRPRAP